MLLLMLYNHKTSEPLISGRIAHLRKRRKSSLEGLPSLLPLSLRGLLRIQSTYRKKAVKNSQAVALYLEL